MKEELTTSFQQTKRPPLPDGTSAGGSRGDPSKRMGIVWSIPGQREGPKLFSGHVPSLQDSLGSVQQGQASHEATLKHRWEEEKEGS